MKQLTLSPLHDEPPTRDNAKHPKSLPDAKVQQVHPTASGDENARLLFVGTATVILYVCSSRVLMHATCAGFPYFFKKFIIKSIRYICH